MAGETKKQHISREQLLKFSPEELFKKIKNHCHNYLYNLYVRRPKNQWPEEEKEEFDPSGNGYLADDDLDWVDKEAVAKVIEDFKYGFKKLKKSPESQRKGFWLEDIFRTRKRERTIWIIHKEYRISLEAAEIKYEMDYSARSKMRQVKRR